MKLEKQMDSRKRVDLSRDLFFLLFLRFRICMATCRPFEVVLGLPAACLAAVASLFCL